MRLTLAMEPNQQMPKRQCTVYYGILWYIGTYDNIIWYIPLPDAVSSCESWQASSPTQMLSLSKSSETLTLLIETGHG